MRHVYLSILLFLSFTHAAGQRIQYDLPRVIDPKGYFLFYLHGGVVTVKGDNAINDPVPQYGPYQYSRILDTLRAHGFMVLSERRLPDVDDSVYVNKIVRQLDTLTRAGVRVNNILMVGASAGSNIVLHVAGRVEQPDMKYVIMGGCWPDAYKSYSTLHLTGEFLSIIESSDPHGTCSAIFGQGNTVRFKEIVLKTGLEHGFIYRPYAAWVDPVVQWFQIFAEGYRARKPALIDGH